jgi:uncharacterized membrane protein YfcA
MELYVWVGVILFLAGFTQGFTGFGSILLSIPLLALLLDIKTVIPLTALAGLTMTVVLLIQLRSHLDWRKINPFLITAIPGVPVGVFFLKQLDKSIIQWILGVILISYGLYGLFIRPSGKGIGDGWAYVFGFFAGCLGGAVSAASPPVIVYTSLKAWTKDQIKVTLQGFFLISGAVVVFSQAVSGVTTMTVLKLYGVSLPGLVLGTYVGSLLYGMVKEAHYRKVMLLLLAVLGGFMIYRA